MLRDPASHVQSCALDSLAAAAPSVADELHALLALRDHWDGEHARRITAAAAECAASILLMGREAMNGELYDPAIAPLADGGIEIDWEGRGSPDKTLMIVIPPSGTDARYLYTDRRGKRKEEAGALGSGKLRRLLTHISG